MSSAPIAFFNAAIFADQFHPQYIPPFYVVGFEMAGLLSRAADVVGGNGHSNDEDEDNRFPAIVFTLEQQKYVRELEQKATSLRRSIQDLRQRIPPPNISQSLPHLHAHSLASNAALALQLNGHSATREQVTLFSLNLGPFYFQLFSSFGKKFIIFR